jgi:hypothetical protein
VTRRNRYSLHMAGLVAVASLASLPVDNTFAASPVLLSPRGGESWAVDSYHLVRWDPKETGNTQGLAASYSTDGGTTWIKISRVNLNPSRGVLRWKIPGPEAKTVRLQISNPSSEITVSHTIPFEIVPSQAVNNYQWQRVTDKAAYAGRDGAGSLTFKKKMFLIGGWNPGNKQQFPMICNNEVWSSMDGKDWVLVKKNTHLDNTFDRNADWEGRHTGGYVVYRDRMWLIGGDTNQGHYQPDIWNSADGRTWTQVNPQHRAPWSPRALHHTVVFKDRIWVMGGQTMPAFAPSDETFYRDIWTTTDGKTWTEVKPREPYWSSRGMIGGGVVFNGRLWILGGGTYNTPTTKARKYFNDVWSTPDGVHWKNHTHRAPWPTRQYHHVTVYDGRMWVLGGYRAGDKNDVWYSRDGTNWYRQFGTPWQARHAASVFVHDTSMWMAAGSCMSRDVWRLERSRDPKYRSPREPLPLVRIVVILDGLDDRKGFTFDAKNPNGSPDSFGMRKGTPVEVVIYSRQFGLNYLGDQGRNHYAELNVMKSGDVEFVKWRDGGQSHLITVDNSSRPRRITIRKQ